MCVLCVCQSEIRNQETSFNGSIRAETRCDTGEGKDTPRTAQHHTWHAPQHAFNTKYFILKTILIVNATLTAKLNTTLSTQLQALNVLSV